MLLPNHIAEWWSHDGNGNVITHSWLHTCTRTCTHTHTHTRTPCWATCLILNDTNFIAVAGEKMFWLVLFPLSAWKLLLETNYRMLSIPWTKTPQRKLEHTCNNILGTRVDALWPHVDQNRAVGYNNGVWLRICSKYERGNIHETINIDNLSRPDWGLFIPGLGTTKRFPLYI